VYTAVVIQCETHSTGQLFKVHLSQYPRLNIISQIINTQDFGIFCV